MPARTSSLTALAFAPGVLKTGMPSSEHRATGTLLVPAPHRAMARTVCGISSSWSLWERSSMACAFLASSPGLTSYCFSGNFRRPSGEILLKVLTWNLPGEYVDGSP